MAQIHLLAGDLVSAYRAALPSAEAGDRESIALLVDICTRAGDDERAQMWRSRLSVQSVTPATPARPPVARRSV